MKKVAFAAVLASRKVVRPPDPDPEPEWLKKVAFAAVALLLNSVAPTGTCSNSCP
jgi:hypothetical protein